MAKKEQENDIKNLSFEQAIKELTKIVGGIEAGQGLLEESLGQYERGMALIKHCRDILQKAQKRIEKISKEQKVEDGRQKTERDAD
jgi:exodeoxyribonuclease VII small subunit